MKNNLMKLFFPALLLMQFVLAAGEAIGQPSGQGWYPAGSYPNEYNMGVTTKVRYHGKPSAYIKSKNVKIHGFGTYMQMSLPGEYLGKSVRMSAYIRSKNITAISEAGMWFRVDGDSNKMLAFDNMGNRPIKGTTRWKKYETTLDVPTGAKAIAYGVLLNGSGEVYFTDIHFEILGPATGKNTGDQALPSQPENLDFEH
jgi:hypothetical protein